MRSCMVLAVRKAVVLAIVVAVVVEKTAKRHFLAQRSSGNALSVELHGNFWTGTAACAGAPGRENEELHGACSEEGSGACSGGDSGGWKNGCALFLGPTLERERSF